MTQRIVLITGASDGIGAATARALARRGDRLLLTGRSPAKLAAVADATGAERLAADFARLDDVRALAAWVRERTDRLDVLANNAGGIFAERVMTADGNERTLQVNHLAGFLLTNLLTDRLIAARGTVVNTASAAATKYARLDLDDLDAARGYKATTAYGNAKFATMLHAAGTHARLAPEGVRAVAIYPGDVASNFAKDTGTASMKLFYKGPLARFLRTPEDGAANLIWAMDDAPDPGRTYTERRVPPRRPHPQLADAALADALWAESERRVGLGGAIAG
ncbi:SDR family NAD(P)-dependent oxidoreductase [Demequina soli]|uniref:SDR family NAD(P)-dependent oxidoreductase n=1 Tax=Demequina soli TaxID=1638987 RepID=UPI000783E015|nr:SDR family NAD(P)-dependent oxidoreductase [Demequina soli]